jgi:hypothetical protein
MNIFQKYLSLGLSVIPCKDKIPLFPWKKYQTEFATQEEASNWSGQIACICGAISSGLIVLDFDVKNGERYSEWLKILLEYKPEVPSKMIVEQTPSGGCHVIFRSDVVLKNVKLACNKEGAATIETRGEGGYFVCAPSEKYEFTYGNFEKISKLSNEETDFIITAAMSLNEKIEEKKEPVLPHNQSSGLTPFDDYNTRHDISGLLQSHGWKLLFVKNGVAFFQRPGKDGRGISATWNAVPDRFYVFSTATNFENNHIYKASAVYSLLEHNGNYSEAAKRLYSEGYGSRDIKKEVTAKLVETSNMKKAIGEIYLHGYNKGKTTGWKNLDELYSVIKGQMTVITGMPSMGKSQFLDALMMNLAMSQDWKFAVFSPENYPTYMHYHQLIEKRVGKALTDSANRMTMAEAEQAIDFIDNHFFFIDATEDEINLDAILNKAQDLIATKKIDGLSIDPWNEIEIDKPKDLSTTEYIGKSLRVSRKFARRNNIHLWIAVHPIKMQKDKEGKYPVPELYDCEGSAQWRNKADNGICIHRHSYDNLTNVIVQKIKYRYTGHPGEVVLKFIKESGRYEETPSF